MTRRLDGAINVTYGGSGFPERATFRWRKACQCDAPSTTARFRFRQAAEDGSSVSVHIVFIPGPSCDQCGIPWESDFGGVQ